MRVSEGLRAEWLNKSKTIHQICPAHGARYPMLSRERGTRGPNPENGGGVNRGGSRVPTRTHSTRQQIPTSFFLSPVLSNRAWPLFLFRGSLHSVHQVAAQRGSRRLSSFQSLEGVSPRVVARTPLHLKKDSKKANLQILNPRMI